MVAMAIHMAWWLNELVIYKRSIITDFSVKVLVQGISRSFPVTTDLFILPQGDEPPCEFINF